MKTRNDDDIKKSVDWVVLALYFVLVFAGWFSIYGASYQFGEVTSMFDLSTRAGSQLLWIGISSVAGFVLLKLDSNIYDVFAYFIYAFFIVLLIVTIFIAPDIKGSRSWLVITDSIRLQPAEFTKFAVALALAKFLSSYNFKLLEAKNLAITASIILLPMVLIILQKETGSALVYMAFVLLLYREGLPGMVLISGLCAIVLFVIELKYSDIDLGIISLSEFISIVLLIIISAGIIKGYRKRYPTGANEIILALVIASLLCVSIWKLDIPMNWGYMGVGAFIALISYLLYLAKKYWNKNYIFLTLFAISGLLYVGSVNYVFTDVMQPHQQMRIKVSLGMEDDPMGAGYNVTQSKIAIGSGGFLGKGFLNGTQTKLKYVPEQDTDFIFCTVGEEHGFIGSSIVVLLFLTLIIRLIFLAERQKNLFGRIYGYGVASIFLFHLTINVGMVIGLIPVIGIPLPFFSYGGSSMLGFSILLFIFLRIDMSRKRH